MKKAISQLLGGNMLSKVLGLVREVLMVQEMSTGLIVLRRREPLYQSIL